MAICSKSPSLTTCRPPTDPPLKAMDVYSFRPNKHRYCIIFCFGRQVVGPGTYTKWYTVPYQLKEAIK